MVRGTKPLTDFSTTPGEEMSLNWQPREVKPPQKNFQIWWIPPLHAAGALPPNIINPVGIYQRSQGEKTADYWSA